VRLEAVIPVVAPEVVEAAAAIMVAEAADHVEVAVAPVEVEGAAVTPADMGANQRSLT
jgi:hypothetical protein